MSYVPLVFRSTEIARLQSFMQRYNFATVISHAMGFRVSHLPLLLRPKQGKFGTLIGHMAKANPQWKEFDGERQVMCVFHGPHAYTSPSWYTKKPEVPTWNYTVVHAQGKPKPIHDRDELAKITDDLVTLYEPGLHDSSNGAFIPKSYKDSQLDFIVGFKLEIEELVGKFKLGQNRSAEDQKGIVEGLSRCQDHGSQDLAEFIRTHKSNKPK